MKTSTYTISFASGEENTIKRFNIPSGLTPATKYDVYYMGVSDDGNSETTISKVEATTLADNSIVYRWPLENDVLEANGSGKDATIDGTVNFLNDTEKGKSVTVLEDGFLKLPSVIQGMNETTISIWFRTDENRIWSKLFSFGRGGQPWDGGYREGLWLTPYSDIDGGEPADPLFFEYSGLDEDNNWTISDPWIKGVHTSHPAVGEWHHFAVSISELEFIAYMDGVEILREDLIIDLAEITDTENYIGKGYWADALFKGAVSDLQIHSKALSQEEIGVIMNGGNLGSEETAKAEASIKMYPNPAKNNVTISAKEFNSVEIFNSLGQSVMELNGGKDIEVNTSKFNTGIYIVRFSNDDVSVAKRLVIK